MFVGFPLWLLDEEMTAEEAEALTPAPVAELEAPSGSTSEPGLT